MVEYVPALRIRAAGTGIPADFLSFADSALSLAELTEGFVNAGLVEGVFSHSCNAVDGGRKTYLFGGQGSAAEAANGADWQTLSFAVTGWDERSYEVELVLPADRVTDERRACLHAMAVLYVCRGIALLEVENDLVAAQLTAKERFCVEQVAKGASYLDIGEELDCSVQAVKVHLQRAEAKAACPI